MRGAPDIRVHIRRECDAMTRQEAEQLYYLNKELLTLQGTLDGFIHSSLVRSPQVTGMPFSNTNETSNKVQDFVIKQQTMIDKIKKKQDEILCEKQKILEFIDSIDESWIRAIVMRRCLMCESWKDISIALGSSEDSIKKTYYRFFKHLDNMSQMS